MELGGKELNGDLKALALLASPGKKFKKMLAIEKKLKKLKILLKLKKIVISSKGLKHIIDRHTINGTLSSGKSIFKNKNDIEKLIKASEKITPTLQRGGNYQRIVEYSKNIGIERITGKETKIYTVITDKTGKLITAFPGRP